MNGKKLRELRKELGLTQTQLAELIGRTSMRTVQNWEAGKNSIPEYVEKTLKEVIDNKKTPYCAKEIKNKLVAFPNMTVDDKLNFLYQQNEELKKDNDELKDMVDNLSLKIEISLAPILRHFKLKADSKEKQEDSTSVN